MVQQLQTTPQALQITPLVSFNESGQLQLHTNQDINSLAYRYALKELNPFLSHDKQPSARHFHRLLLIQNRG